jgi:DNA-directed RNA polymerase specialized sigma24 family protein
MDGDHVAAWLWVVGLRCWVNEWRHRQGVATHLAPVALGVLTAPGADEVVLDRELGVRVVAIVDAMPARTRAVLSALSDGVAPDEVGRRFGMQRNAVNVLVHRARAHVHRRLAAEERTARQGRT